MLSPGSPKSTDESSSALAAVLAPECPVCWECFDLNGQSPRLIACGHTICEGCASSLPVTRDFFGKRCISCPECRRLVVWKGLKFLPRNFALQRIVSDYLPAGQKKRQRQKAAGAIPDMKSFTKSLDAGSMLYFISSLASVVSILCGVLLGMFVFIPLCLVYVTVSWMIASLTLFAFALISAAALGFGTAGGLSFCTYQVSKYIKIWK